MLNFQIINPYFEDTCVHSVAFVIVFSIQLNIVAVLVPSLDFVQSRDLKDQ
jgi:hypothetical protein